jgi:putative membrane protein
MKIASYIGLLVGLVVLTALIAWSGAKEIGSLLLASGWSLLWVPVIWLPSLPMNARCWQLLFDRRFAPTFWRAFYAQWMGRAVNTLLPVASIGGEVAKTRALILWGTDVHHASAAAVVDKTVEVITIILWGLAGIVLLALMALDNTLAMASLLGLAALGAGVVGFLFVQRAGMFGVLVRLAYRLTKSEAVARLLTMAEEVDRVILDLYRQRGQVAAATAWRLAALVVQSGEVWLAASLLGHPIGILEAVMLKSLSNTVSDAAFVIPNSYGIQEGALIVLGGLVGLTPDVALAISLAIRIREIIIDVPGLICWQIVEGRAFFRRRRA